VSDLAAYLNTEVIDLFIIVLGVAALAALLAFSKGRI
jgi:hypothetical protein